MMSDKRDVVCYLENNKFFRDYKIIGKKSGLSNTNYFIESNSKKYIVRFNKKKSSNRTKILKDEHHVLKFFENMNIGFVPRSLFYDEENNIHILTYLEGKKIRFKNISSSGMEQAITKLHQINLLADEYNHYCKINNIETLVPHSELEKVKEDIIDAVEAIDGNSVFCNEKDWILERLKNDFKNYKQNKKYIFLNHGDPADNLIIYKKEIYFIDWEYVKLTYGPGLIHILAHGRLDSEKEKKLLKAYAKISKMNYEELCYKAYMEKMVYYLLKMVKLFVKFEKEMISSEEDFLLIKENIEHLKNLYLKNYQVVYANF